ncbi:efflux transporter outer membrane subunit [Burkholderia sp. L27(2015)]|uniref:efflux transporter outer membrane subunit n=1 Tax=Burkholderia sp. L27(2015) TaxID=1641858 RepID=UPI00131B327B|nr:efflux transporter outer membrane subunit [Burkholderia sp. L27(2015)]
MRCVSTQRLALIIFAAALAGCSMAPAYQRPQAPVPVNYPVVCGATASVNEASSLDDWRGYFTEPVLDHLIEVALASNRDLRAASLRIQEARALYGIQLADRLPGVDGTVSYNRGRTVDPMLNENVVASQYQAALGVTAFELDLFGRVKSLSDAALADYFASEEAQRAVQISLIAEVASAYVAERALYDQEKLAQQTLTARDGIYALTKRRYGAGMSTAIELRTAEMLVQSARASLAALARERTQAANALRLLLGDFTVDLPRATPVLDDLSIAPVAAGLSSDLLIRRPDIRAAEQRLKAANANIGAARAAFFPSVRITADMGSVSDSFSRLFAGGTGAWSFAPQLTLPIFSGGRNRANLNLATVRKDIAVTDYEKAIQTAFREVSDALAARDQIDAQLDAQKAVCAADGERMRLAQRRYQSGVATYLELLDAQRSLFESGQALIQLKQLRLTNAISLYRALGGGWSSGESIPIYSMQIQYIQALKNES